jgi:hypothetical protein
VVLTYLGSISRYSRAQVARLASRWVEGKLLVKQYRAPELAFTKVYTAVVMALLAKVDQAMGTVLSH